MNLLQKERVTISFNSLQFIKVSKSTLLNINPIVLNQKSQN